jgi:hypothetical protein
MTLMPWQRSNVLHALNYLKELARASKDPRAEMLWQGLHDVLEPARRAIRLQREAAQSATALVPAGRERRTSRDRRALRERRRNQETIGFSERRTGRERRSADRRASFY